MITDYEPVVVKDAQVEGWDLRMKGDLAMKEFMQ
jgi:hypothetical protein